MVTRSLVDEIFDVGFREPGIDPHNEIVNFGEIVLFAVWQLLKKPLQSLNRPCVAILGIAALGSQRIDDRQQEPRFLGRVYLPMAREHALQQSRSRARQ